MYVPVRNLSRSEISPTIHVELVNGDIINPIYVPEYWYGSEEAYYTSLENEVDGRGDNNNKEVM